MADITMELIQKLREETGAGVMDAKKALTDTDGDFDKAVEIVRAKGAERAEKRAERETGAGHIETYVHNGRIGVMLEMRAETDFVVRSEPFQDVARGIALHIAAMGEAETVEELLAQPFIKDPDKKVGDIVTEVGAKTGEKVTFERFVRYEV
jgi:elongation factor Ts